MAQSNEIFTPLCGSTILGAIVELFPLISSSKALRRWPQAVAALTLLLRPCRLCLILSPACLDLSETTAATGRNHQQLLPSDRATLKDSSSSRFHEIAQHTVCPLSSHKGQFRSEIFRRFPEGSNKRRNTFCRRASEGMLFLNRCSCGVSVTFAKIPQCGHTSWPKMPAWTALSCQCIIASETRPPSAARLRTTPPLSVPCYGPWSWLWFNVWWFQQDACKVPGKQEHSSRAQSPKSLYCPKRTWGFPGSVKYRPGTASSGSFLFRLRMKSFGAAFPIITKNSSWYSIPTKGGNSSGLFRPVQEVISCVLPVSAVEVSDAKHSRALEWKATHVLFHLMNGMLKHFHAEIGSYLHHSRFLVFQTWRNQMKSSHRCVDLPFSEQ